MAEVETWSLVDRPHPYADTPTPRDVARHPIRRAAQLAEVHPQTLREYERRGLLQPERTEGGMRLYRDSDVKVARRVRALTDDGCDFDSVRRVVGLERRIARLIAHIRVLEDQNMRLSARLARASQAVG